jgi:cytoskeletal protein RodZ
MTPTKKPTPRVPPWEQRGEGEATSFGTWLRRQREAREISLREIAEASKISLRYLEALEDDRFDVLPAPVFARGFLREYSKVVGLNPDEVVNNYLAAQKTDDEIEPEAAGEAARARGSQRDWGYGLLLSLAVVLLLGLVALLAFWAERRRANTPPPQTSIAPPAAVVKPVAVPAAPTVPAPEPPLRVTLDFAADCWVEVQSDGKPRSSELRARGETLEIEAKQLIVLTLGNPDGVKVEVNGHPLPLQATAGKVLHDLRIDLETAKGLGG